MKTLSRVLLSVACASTVPPAWGIVPLASSYQGVSNAVPVVSPHDQLMAFLFRSVRDPRQLAGYRVALLATDGVDAFDLEVPRQYLRDRGATVHVIVPRPRSVLRATGSGATIRPMTRITVLDPSGLQSEASIDRFLDQVTAESYDVVYVPGHRGSVDERTGLVGMAFLRQAAATGKAIFSAGNALQSAAEGVLLPMADAAPTTDSSRADVGRFPVSTAARVYLGHDAFEIPWLVDRLVETLLSRPVVADR